MSGVTITVDDGPILAAFAALAQADLQPAMEAIGAHLVATHLAALDTLAARVERVCLITDTVQREEDRAGRTVDSADLLFGIAVPPAPETWDWEIAPFGEIARRRRLIHRMHGYPDWKAARQPVR